VIKMLAENKLDRFRSSSVWHFIASKYALFFHFMVSAVVVLGCPRTINAQQFKSSILNNTTIGCIDQCAEEFPVRPPLILVQARQPVANTAIGPWHLVRTPAPEDKETVSIMRTGELLKSDPDFAGMMIRCRPTAGLQIGFVVIPPFPPKSKPKLTISTGQTNLDFQTSVIAPGTIIVLPDEADALVQGPWQSAQSLRVRIQGNGADIHGTVPLNQLSQAVALLQANCPAQ
jgi:hypothetical protein